MARGAALYLSMPGSAGGSPPAYRVPTARVKALYLCALELRGPDAARTLIEPHLDPAALENEAALVSRAAWLRAVRKFGETLGDRGFDELSDYIVHPQNLGFWSALLRGARCPEDVYPKLVGSMGDLAAPLDWAEERAEPRHWRGSCSLEDVPDGATRWVERALRAELAAVSLLFGRPRGATRVVGRGQKRLLIEIEIGARRAPWLVPIAALSLGLGVLGSSLVLSLGSAWPIAVLFGLSVASVGVLGQRLYARERHHRENDRAQRTRIAALEREASMQEERAVRSSLHEALVAGEYELGEQLGVGGTGAVWEARRKRDGMLVALKVLRAGAASDSRASDRLQREAEALGLAWHPHVVRILEHGVLPSGLGYLVMERLRGETLAARARRLRRLAPREVTHFGLQAAEALRAVHSAGIVHRDVKPGNLFIHREGSVEILKLLDFGSAHVNWAETRLTRDGAAVGTRGYAAPEQELGAEPAATADIYSLGVSLIELLTGEAPLHTGSAARLRVARRELAPATAEPAKLEAALYDVLFQMAADEPSARPAGAREAHARLQALLADEGVGAVKEGPTSMAELAIDRPA